MRATKRSKQTKAFSHPMILFWKCDTCLSCKSALLQPKKGKITTAKNISFFVGHWKFVLQFFMGAIETKHIIWNGINWHIDQIRARRVALDWGWLSSPCRLCCPGLPNTHMLRFIPNMSCTWLGTCAYHSVTAFHPQLSEFQRGRSAEP